MAVVMMMAVHHRMSWLCGVLQSPSHFSEIVIDIKIGTCYVDTNWYLFVMWWSLYEESI